MTLFERMRALPEDCRAALRRASAWAVLAALLDAACGVLLVPLVEAWFAEGALPWRWVAALLGLSLAQALLQYLALRRGFAAGGSLAAGLVRSLVARLPRLARGLLSAAPLLLLDEPTASLDAASEAQVLRSLLGLRGRRTLLVVTHRPALARQADQVLLLEKGRLRLSGRHADLLVRDDWYAGFVGLAGEESSATAVDR